MAAPSNLMQLGMPHMLARRVGQPALSISPVGASRASAPGMIGHNVTYYITTTANGSGLVLPTVGGDSGAGVGALDGDQLQVFNLISASIVVYAPTGYTFTGDGASTDGATGISVASHRAAIFVPLTASTYGVIKGISA